MDYVGVALLAVGVGALQVMLDKGQEDDWFGSHFIVTLAVLAAVGLLSLILWEWFQKNPIVEVRLFKNLNFLGANLMIFIVGIMLFSSLVMMPLFLQTLLGYTSESAGLVLSGGGLVLLFLMPVVGALAGRVQARYLIAFGWFMLSIGMFYSTRRLDLQISFGSASALRVTQVFGLAFLFVPINLVGFSSTPMEKSNSASGLINFMRNMGSSVGTSMVTTLLARRAQVRQVYLAAHIGPGHPAFNQAASALAARLAASGVQADLAAQKALGMVYQGLVGQATTLAYIDTFAILGGGAALMFLLSFALRGNRPGGGTVALE